MNVIFLHILDMSITASYIILAVLLIRLLLYKTAKKYSYLLWSVVGFRLCCPFSLQASFSVLNLRKLLPDKMVPSLQIESDQLTASTTWGTSTPSPTIPDASNTLIGSDYDTGFALGDAALSETVPLTNESLSLENLIVVIWLTGIATLLIYSLIRYINLHRELRTAILLQENIYQSDQVCSPFILGFIKPRIYIPFGLDSSSLAYVLEHEQYHIKRRDYLIKTFAFVLLCLHWFNPLCWLAFYLMGKDMEMSCDEKVLSQNTNIRKAYSTTLLSFATNHRFPAPEPLAFGESGVKSRIKNALNWKRPGIWATLIAIIICTATIAVCITNPTKDTTNNIFQSRNDDISPSGIKNDFPTAPDTAFAFEYNNTFTSMEDYAAKKIEQLIGSSTGYYSHSQKSPVQATITNAKVSLLEKKADISNLAPDGTLEAWVFHYLVQLEVDSKDIMLVGGQNEPEKGWYSLSDSAYTLMITLRQADGTYRILECMWNDTISLFDCYHRNMTEALYDWGVTYYQLALPLNCQMFTTKGSYSQYYWRIDGDNWYFYQFAPSLDYWTQADNGSFSWTGKHGFTISVTPLKRNAKTEVESLISLEAVVEEGNYIYVKHAKNNVADYYYNAPDGGCYRVRTDYPMDITPTVDPDILDVMARSFVITSNQSNVSTSDN